MFTNPVLYHLWFCSTILNPTLHFFLQTGHLKWNMQHHSSTSRTTALWGNLSPL